MSIWYALCDATHLEFLRMTFMKNALLAVFILAPLFGLLSTMIVTGRMSFFSDALGHSAFTGIAIGVLCGSLQPTVWAVALAAAFALLFSFVRSRSRQSADTIIGVFSSTAVALGIFIATLGGNSFTKFNRYLIGDILSVTPGEIGLLALVLLGVLLLWVFAANRLFLTAVHPQLASSRGIPTEKTQTLFTVCIAVVVTLAMSWVGLMVINSLLVLPAASSRNLARNLRAYHLFSVLGALACSVLGLVTAYYLGCSAGATMPGWRDSSGSAVSGSARSCRVRSGLACSGFGSSCRACASASANCTGVGSGAVILGCIAGIASSASSSSS